MPAIGAFSVLLVSDMPRAVGFWRDVVGCTTRFETSVFSEVFAGESVICLRPGADDAERQTTLGVDVDDLAATCAAIAASAGRVVHPPRDGGVPNLLTAVAVDTEGNTFALTSHTGR